MSDFAGVSAPWLKNLLSLGLYGKRVEKARAFLLFGALYKIRRRTGSRFVKIHKSTRIVSGWTYTRISHGVDIAARGEGGDGTVGAGGGELANRFAAAVARNKHAGRLGAAILTGGGVSRRVKLYE